MVHVIKCHCGLIHNGPAASSYAVKSFGGARHKFHCSSEISLAICTLAMCQKSQVPPRTCMASPV